MQEKKGPSKDFELIIKQDLRNGKVIEKPSGSTGCKPCVYAEHCPATIHMMCMAHNRPKKDSIVYGVK